MLGVASAAWVAIGKFEGLDEDILARAMPEAVTNQSGEEKLLT
jgi:hypothetical protein